MHEVTIAWSARDGIFIARVPELPGCMAHGPTYEAAHANIQEAMSLWIETALEDGVALPEPLQYVAST